MVTWSLPPQLASIAGNCCHAALAWSLMVTWSMMMTWSMIVTWKNGACPAAATAARDLAAVVAGGNVCPCALATR